MRLFRRNKHIFFTGIGGSGMSGIAEILMAYGCKVSGSDREATEITAYLSNKGANIQIGHDATNLKDVDALVYSSAIAENNIERMEAKKRDIPQIRRAEMLAELMRLKYGIAVAGTHGKTTTASICAELLLQQGLNPDIVIGGRLKSLKSGAYPGRGDLFVTEADEYDRSFLALTPTFAIITSIEADHMECYDDFDHLKRSFTEFANKVPYYGSVIACIDETHVKEILPGITKATITYGLNEDADYRAINVQLLENRITFDVQRYGKFMFSANVNIPGEHNIKNSLAAIALCNELEIPNAKIISGLDEYQGVWRRFDIKAMIDNIMLVDDYAHHPTEIKATLQSAKKGWDKRVIAIFQPHLFSRTRDFYREFASSLTIADIVILTDIYAAREQPIKGVSSELISEEMKKLGFNDVYYIPGRMNLASFVIELAQPQDMIFTLGAGDIWEVGDEIIQRLKKS